MGDRYIECDENTKLLYIDANILYGWAVSQYLPTGDFKKIKFLEKDDSVQCDELLDENKENNLSTPDDNENGYFTECDLEYPADFKERNRKHSTLALSNKSRSRVFLRLYESCKTTQ